MNNGLFGQPAGPAAAVPTLTGTYSDSMALSAAMPSCINPTFTVNNKSVWLPDATVLKAGGTLLCNNPSGSNAYALRRWDGTLVCNVLPGCTAMVSLLDNSMPRGSWKCMNFGPGGGCPIVGTSMGGGAPYMMPVQLNDNAWVTADANTLAVIDTATGTVAKTVGNFIAAVAINSSTFVAFAFSNPTLTGYVCTFANGVLTVGAAQNKTVTASTLTNLTNTFPVAVEPVPAAGGGVFAIALGYSSGVLAVTAGQVVGSTVVWGVESVLANIAQPYMTIGGSSMVFDGTHGYIAYNSFNGSATYNCVCLSFNVSGTVVTVGASTGIYSGSTGSWYTVPCANICNGSIACSYSDNGLLSFRASTLAYPSLTFGANTAGTSVSSGPNGGVVRRINLTSSTFALVPWSANTNSGATIAQFSVSGTSISLLNFPSLSNDCSSLWYDKTTQRIYSLRPTSPNYSLSSGGFIKSFTPQIIAKYSDWTTTTIPWGSDGKAAPLNLQLNGTVPNAYSTGNADSFQQFANAGGVVVFSSPDQSGGTFGNPNNQRVDVLSPYGAHLGSYGSALLYPGLLSGSGLSMSGARGDNFGLNFNRMASVSANTGMITELVVA